MIALAALALTVLNMVTSANKNIEQRLCRLEGVMNVGECKK